MKVHILDDWMDTLRSLPCFAKLAGHDVTIWTDHEPDPRRLAQRVKDAQALVLFRERTRIGADLLAQLPKLRLISQRSVYPHIDLQACTEKGVLLCSNMHSDTPSYAAAELTLGLMLASFRQLPQQAESLRQGKWQMGVGRSLRGRKLGLYGYGRIAQAVETYALALGMQVQWWASETGRARALAQGKTLAESRESFFATSDIVSLHVRLNPQTKGIITADDLSNMRAGSLLVNTARAGLIAQNALETEMARGRIFAAIDVFESEPLRQTSHPLLNHPNVLATPHIGYVTEDEYDLQFSDIFDQINAYGSGAPIHMVNPEVWGRGA